MIKQVLIKDYILIDELLVEFSDGLNVITGETGAGKSIMINAIDVVFFPSSHHTVNSYVNEAVDLIEAGVIEILPHGKGVNKQHVYMPEKNLEILNANIHENECGGGKRVKTSFNAEERDPWDYELPTSSSRSHFVS